MTELDLEMPELVSDILKEFGNSGVVYSLNIPGVYDPTQGRALPGKVSIRVPAAVTGGGFAGAGGDMVADGSISLIVAASAFSGHPKPSAGDRFYVNGQVSIVGERGVSPIYSGDVVAAYKIIGQIEGYTLSAGLVEFKGEVEGVSNFNGYISLRLSFYGFIFGNSQFSSLLTTKLKLIGSIQATSSLIGFMRKGRKLSGAVQGSSLIIGALRASSTFAGYIVGNSQFTASLKINKYLNGSIYGSSNFAASINLSKKLVGSIQGMAIFIAYLKLVLKLNGSISGSTVFAGNITKATSNEEAETTALAAQMSPAPTSQRRVLINNLIAGLKTDGVWNKLDWFMVAAAHSAQAARLNWKVPTKIATVTVSPIFTVDFGYKGDGDMSCLNIPEPLANGGQFEQNSATMGIWVNGSLNSTVSVICGNTAVAGQTNLNASNSNNSIRMASSTALAASNSGTKAHFTGVRTASNVTKSYVNGVDVATGSSTSAVPPTENPRVLAARTGFSPVSFAAYYTGSALSSTDVQNIHNRLNTYLTTLGAN